MKSFYIIAALSLVTMSCDPSSVKKEDSEKKDVSEKKIELNDADLKEIDEQKEVVDSKTLPSGILIKWLEHGKGTSVKSGDYLKIDYRVSLKDGRIVDGNHKNKLESVPFIVDAGMQTKGWDIALKELNVGDFAEIIIPADLARGEKGIPGMIPPNSDNILRVRIIESREPDRISGTTKVWTFQENQNNSKVFNEKNKVSFHCMATTKSSNAPFINTYAGDQPFELRLNDAGIVPGLKAGLVGAKRADRCFILVQSKDAYGKKGYLDLVKPNEQVLYNIFVVDVVD